MTLHRSALASLVLYLGLPAAPHLLVASLELGGISADGSSPVQFGTAAGGDGKVKYQVKQFHFHTSRVDVTPNGQVQWTAAALVSGATDGTVASVVASLESDAGKEALPLVESDAWLHGATTISALPKTEARMNVAIYGEIGGTAQKYLTFRLGTDGSLALETEKTEAECSSRTGCDDPVGESKADEYDIEVLAAQLFATNGGYDVSIDLNGADVYGIAYGEIEIVESDETTTCDKATGECTTTGSTTTTMAEIGWDDIGSVWEAETALEHSGVISVTTQTYDSAANKLESAKSALGALWDNDSAGVNSLATDEDPLTSVALHRWDGGSADGRQPGFWSGSQSIFSIVSEGWNATSTLPTQAQLELGGGGTISVPVNSYQKRPPAKGTFWAVFCARKYSWSGFVPINAYSGKAAFENISFDDLDAPICEAGTCITLTENDDGTCNISASVYGDDATTLGSSVELVVTELDEKGNPATSEKLHFELDDEIIAVFSNELDFSADPIGLDLSGKVSLLGAADNKGKQETLAKGKFYGSFSRNGDGELTLAGADKNAVSSRGDVVVPGKAVAFELTDTDKDGRIEPPPVAAQQYPKFNRYREGWARISMVSAL